MYQKGFRQILLGFLCVLIDIRFGGLDVLLPDFVGYILVMRGLGMLSSVHFSFRRGWYLSVLLAVLSLAQLFEIPVDLGTPHDARNQLLAYVTGDPMYLLPDGAGKLALAESAIPPPTRDDVELTESPQSAVLGRYSDGTELRIERFAAANGAQRMMTEYAERVYNDAYFGPNATVRTGRGSAASNHVEVTRRVLRETDDKTVLLLWFRGKDWWNPWSWFNPGGVGASHDLLILEGSPESVRHFEQVIQAGNKEVQPRVVVSPFQFLIVLGNLLELWLVWLLCQGIAAIAMQQGEAGLARQARVRRWIYLIVTGVAWSLPWLLILVPTADHLNLPTVYGFTLTALLRLAATALILLLLLRASRLRRGQSGTSCRNPLKLSAQLADRLMLQKVHDHLLDREPGGVCRAGLILVTGP